MRIKPTTRTTSCPQSILGTGVIRVWQTALTRHTRRKSLGRQLGDPTPGSIGLSRSSGVLIS
ncbi:hypothetical protein K443DRAFT_630568 [Laccaria amethystina LaAM-08-1]|uniref:Uncharacterized protein n=1 Tax=Laccaria amethystina LaAM-08-1 TaxID=1095629 RepID=A0A0C9WM19_9AGAR|nr:hypothetical protein K443DRAFT_630568 [Laccaria amethystina LaAM-08-1]